MSRDAIQAAIQNHPNLTVVNLGEHDHLPSPATPGLEIFLKEVLPEIVNES